MDLTNTDPFYAMRNDLNTPSTSTHDFYDLDYINELDTSLSRIKFLSTTASSNIDAVHNVYELDTSIPRVKFLASTASTTDIYALYNQLNSTNFNTMGIIQRTRGNDTYPPPSFFNTLDHQ
jgi:hypothetical protein